MVDEEKILKKNEDIATEALELSPEEEAFSGKKTKARFRFPQQWRFPLIWILFFSIMGIIIQSFQAHGFVFTDFFGINYIDWFRSFGSFVDPTAYATPQDLLYSIMAEWYYFFYTGGLVALIWEILAWIIHSEVRLTGKRKKPKIQPKEQKIIPKPAQQKKQSVHRINALLFQGKKLLLEGKKSDAINIYEEIQGLYDPKQDLDKKQYNAILEFYNKIPK